MISGRKTYHNIKNNINLSKNKEVKNNTILLKNKEVEIKER